MSRWKIRYFFLLYPKCCQQIIEIRLKTQRSGWITITNGQILEGSHLGFTNVCADIVNQIVGTI